MLSQTLAVKCNRSDDDFLPENGAKNHMRMSSSLDQCTDQVAAVLKQMAENFSYFRLKLI